MVYSGLCSPLCCPQSDTDGISFIFEGLQRLLRSSYKESLQAFVKVQISLGNYHASNMRGKGDALPSGPL